MDIKISEPLKVEHEELHAELVALTQGPGKVGDAARSVAALLHPHFVKEEEYALPPLGLLVAVAQGRVTRDMQAVITMTQRLQNELPDMLAEHQQVVDALGKLVAAARVRSGPRRRAEPRSSGCTPRRRSRCCTRRRSSWASRCARGSGCEASCAADRPRRGPR